jgi:hypothetical protein
MKFQLQPPVEIQPQNTAIASPAGCAVIEASIFE